MLYCPAGRLVPPDGTPRPACAPVVRSLPAPRCEDHGPAAMREPPRPTSLVWNVTFRSNVKGSLLQSLYCMEEKTQIPRNKETFARQLASCLQTQKENPGEPDPRFMASATTHFHSAPHGARPTACLPARLSALGRVRT